MPLCNNKKLQAEVGFSSFERQSVPERNLERRIRNRDFFARREEFRKLLIEIWPCCFFQSGWELHVEGLGLGPNRSFLQLPV